jgi:hypothetical protein
MGSLTNTVALERIQNLDRKHDRMPRFKAEALIQIGSRMLYG